MDIYLQKSTKTALQKAPCNDPVHVVYQFFTHREHKRNQEILHCLKRHVGNPMISRIHLINERLFSPSELGIESDKIIQTNIQRRAEYRDIFEYVDEADLRGYIVMCNADIFMDSTLANLFQSGIHVNKVAYAQLRFEYTGQTLGKCLLHGDDKTRRGRCDSQDTWVYHSNFNPSRQQRKAFNFQFGRLGCDNKIAYLLAVIGFDVRNEPYLIKTYHAHDAPAWKRDYSMTEKIPQPYLLIAPYVTGVTAENVWSGLSAGLRRLGTSVTQFTGNGTRYMFDRDNKTMYDFISSQLARREHFTIPRVGGCESNVAVAVQKIQHMLKNPRVRRGYLAKYQGRVMSDIRGVLKNNAGIRICNQVQAQEFSDIHLNSFQQAKLVTAWAPWDGVYGITQDAHKVIGDIMIKNRAGGVHARVLDVYHYIHRQPWTHALRGQRILVISTFADSIREKIGIREKIYGVDLFPDCEFVFVRPPQTQASNPSRAFTEELYDFTKDIEAVRDAFDVALVACGGYGNLICSNIYDMGKSCILVGGVLQMYFGIYGKRWMKDNKDVLTMYLNEHWSRPQASERPKAFENIEGGCYF